MAHPLESEYVMLETFTEPQPADGVEDTATVSSPDMDRLNQEADVASTALRHAEDEASAGLSLFGKIRDLTRHMDDLRVQFQNIEDAGSWCLWPSCRGASTLLSG